MCVQFTNVFQFEQWVYVKSRIQAQLRYDSKNTELSTHPRFSGLSCSIRLVMILS